MVLRAKRGKDLSVAGRSAIKLYRTRGLNPRVQPKGRATASPPCGIMDRDSTGEPHRLCARLKRRGLQLINRARLWEEGDYPF